MMNILIVSASLAALAPATAGAVERDFVKVAPAVALNQQNPSPASRSTGRPDGCYDLLLCTSSGAKAVLSVPASIFTGSPADPAAVYPLRPLDSSDGGTWWTSNPQEIPLPPAAWGGFAGLLTVAGFGYIRRRRLCRE